MINALYRTKKKQQSGQQPLGWQFNRSYTSAQSLDHGGSGASRGNLLSIGRSNRARTDRTIEWQRQQAVSANADTSTAIVVHQECRVVYERVYIEVFLFNLSF